MGISSGLGSNVGVLILFAFASDFHLLRFAANKLFGSKLKTDINVYKATEGVH